MKTIKGSSTSVYIEKKSEFIANIKNINTEKEAKDFIEAISKEHFNATHNVWVYRIATEYGEITKYSDDGEPKDTAGKPSYELLKKIDISNVAVVITRYFGGIKLGAGGLIRAYAKATKVGLENSEIIDLIYTKEYIISFSYSELNVIDKYINDNNIEVEDKSYTDNIFYKLRLSKEQYEYLKNINIEIIDMEI